MTLMKVVDGAHLECSAEEEAAILAEQALRDPASNVELAKQLKRDALRREALARVRVKLPALNTFAEVELVREQWLSIAPAARQPTATFQYLIDVVQAARAAATSINALATAAEVMAYDIQATPGWPAP